MELLFCNAPKRVTHCVKTTNLCCLRCDQSNSCLGMSEALKSMKPCQHSQFDEDDVCEFLI
jgi:hypothetical protein